MASNRLAIAGLEALGIVEGDAVIVLVDEAFAAKAGEEAAHGFS